MNVETLTDQNGNEITTASAIEMVFNCILFLAGRCNGASSYDGAGFSKFDVEMGHSFASKIEQGYNFTPRMLAAAHRLCVKYRKQLGLAGLPIPDKGLLPEVPPPAPNVTVEPIGSGNAVKVTFGRFNRDWNEQLKNFAAINGTRAIWAPELRAWTVSRIRVEDFDTFVERLNG